MADAVEFVNGLIVKAPRNGAPDYVIAAISIKREELIAWLQGKSDEWINVDVKESRGGKWYASVNAYKPKAGATETARPDKPISGDFESDIPF